MINILINTLKSTINNKFYYIIILDKLYNEILKQYIQYHNNENVLKYIIIDYLSWIQQYFILYHKRSELKEHCKIQIDLNIKQLLNYLDKVKDGKYR